MFQLIVAVISIALIAALAIAGIFYGGDAFNQGTLKANVTTLVNGGQQISGAQALYKTEHAGVTAKTLEESAADANDGLVGEYLNAIPGVSGIAASGWDLSDDGKIAFAPLKADGLVEVCAETDRQAGNAEIANPTASSWSADEPVAQFGCFTTGEVGSEVVAFGFKL